MPLDSGLLPPEACPRACIFVADRRNFEGHRVYCGRYGDMLMVIGMAVSPSEIEGALCAHPDVPESDPPKAAAGRIQSFELRTECVATGGRA